MKVRPFSWLIAEKKEKITTLLQGYTDETQKIQSGPSIGDASAK